MANSVFSGVAPFVSESAGSLSSGVDTIGSVATGVGLQEQNGLQAFDETCVAIQIENLLQTMLQTAITDMAKDAKDAFKDGGDAGHKM